MKKIIGTVLLVFLSFPAIAFNAYKCTTADSKEMTNQGLLAESKVTKKYMPKGSEFVVDKKTGRMIGDLQNHNDNGEPVVLDQGSSHQAFKAVTIFKPFVTVEYLYIEEFAEGKNKPFLFIEGSRVATGICIPY